MDETQLMAIMATVDGDVEKLMQIVSKFAELTDDVNDGDTLDALHDSLTTFIDDDLESRIEAYED